MRERLSRRSALKRDGQRIPLRARSVVGLLPLPAVTTLGPATLARLPELMRRVEWFTANRPEGKAVVRHTESEEHAGWRMLSIVDEERLVRLLRPMLEPNEFLSDHGLRALSKYHEDHPLQVAVDGVTATLDYEPGESTSGLFGGNSNWRGPVWFPINYLLLETLLDYHRYLGDGFTVECPTGSANRMTLAEVADELARRLASIFLRRDDGTRPVFGGYELLRRDPAWHDLIPFHEYFHGDTGAGIGASHQTGWTGLVADLIIRRRRAQVSAEPPKPQRVPAQVQLRARVLLRSPLLELVTEELPVADDLGVVAGLDHVRIAGADLHNRPVVVRHTHPPRLHDTEVPVLAALGSRNRLDALGPAPPGLEREPRSGRPTDVNDVRPRLRAILSPPLLGGQLPSSSSVIRGASPNRVAASPMVTKPTRS